MNGSLNAIIVDDHPVLRKAMAEIISNLDFIKNCHEAENGIVALEKFQNLVYDVACIDLSMPLMNGIEAARYIKKNYPDTLIIILTIYYDKLDVLELMAIGVNGYLLKTMTEDEIAAAFLLIK